MNILGMKIDTTKEEFKRLPADVDGQFVISVDDRGNVLATSSRCPIRLIKESKSQEITEGFSNAVQNIANVLPHEMLTWKDQEDEARAYIADGTVTTPVLSSLVEARGLGETVEELANKVLANADAYRAAYYPLLGKYQALLKQVDNATTVEELEAIVW